MVEKYKTVPRLVKNKAGKAIGKEVRITPTNNFKLSIFELNKAYKTLLQTNDINKINIRAMTKDGMKTLKTFDYLEDDLMHTLDDYYSSLPKEKRKKFKELEDVYIFIKF